MTDRDLLEQMAKTINEIRAEQRRMQEKFDRYVTKEAAYVVGLVALIGFILMGMVAAKFFVPGA